MRNERGISLIEIVVAVAIMAVVLLFLSRGFMTSMYMSRQSDEFSAAARAAREKMEEVVSSTFRHYERKLENGYLLQIDPKTGFFKTTLNAFTFNELPLVLQMEFVGGVRVTGTPVIQDKVTTCKVPFTSGPTREPYGRTHPFKVYLSDIDPTNPDSDRGLLQGLVDDYAGEVVIINSERVENFAAGTTGPLIDTADIDQVRGVGIYGGDLLPRDGTPDGFMYFRLPIDLNGDGDFADSAASLESKTSPFKLRKYAIGVIVRWQGRYGPERHETWTILSEE